jgi:hypothetical protein
MIQCWSAQSTGELGMFRGAAARKVTSELR